MLGEGLGVRVAQSPIFVSEMKNFRFGTLASQQKARDQGFPQSRAFKIKPYLFFIKSVMMFFGTSL
jgi:hypothetical protein